MSGITARVAGFRQGAAQLATCPAIAGNQTDFGIAVATVLVPAIDRGNMKLVGWTGEQVPRQSGVVYTATKTIAQQPATVERFPRAFRTGAQDYHDAFSGPDERPQNGPTAPKAVAIIAKRYVVPLAGP